MGDLTENFSRKEFACKCGCGYGMREGDVDPELLILLQFIRDAWNKPLHISSGCRCITHNRVIGGSLASKHLLGKAVDLIFNNNKQRKAFYKLVMELYRSGMIPELGGLGYHLYANGCVHIDTFHAEDGHLRIW